MKVKRRIPKASDKFYPVVIELETEAEAYALWQRLNITSKTVAEITGATRKILAKVETQMMGRFDDMYAPNEEK